MRSYICGLWVVCWGTCAVLAGSPAAVQRSGAAFEESPTPPASVLEPGWEERQKLLAADGAPTDELGWSIALSGDAILLGVYQDDDHGTDSGSAYVFERVNGAWFQTAKLTAADGRAYHYFSFPVVLSGDTAFIGAIGDDDHGFNAGSAYIFEKVNGAWAQVAKLTAEDGARDDRFGNSIALSSDTALVSAPYDDDRGQNSGSVYVFEKINGVWTQAAKLTAEDGAAGDGFGYPVALFRDTALIGARGDDDRGQNSGSAYIFENVDGVWTQAAKLTADDGAAEDLFGYSVALFADTALVGAPWDDDRGEISGSAYIFENVNGAWAQVAKLTAADGEANDVFAWNVALSGGTALVSAHGDDDRGDSSGSAYVFEKVNGVWMQAVKLATADGAAGDRFGYSVALSGDTALFGAIGDDDRGDRSGSAYVFERAGGCAGGERIAKAKCGGEPGSGDLKVQLAGGLPDDTFTVTLSTGPVKEGTLNGRGKGKAKFKRLPSGDGTATAEWGCGATDQRDYACP